MTFAREGKFSLLQTVFHSLENHYSFLLICFLPVLYLGSLRSFIPIVIIPQLPFVYQYLYITYGNLVSTSQTRTLGEIHVIYLTSYEFLRLNIGLIKWNQSESCQRCQLLYTMPGIGWVSTKRRRKT